MEDTALAHAGASQREAFEQAEPFEHLVVDDFLAPEFVSGLIEEARNCQDARKSNDYIFAKSKYESPSIDGLGPHSAALREFLLGEPFAAFLSLLMGRTVFVDPDFVGGGLHRGGAGSFLDMHADFNIHPRHQRWIRELNILLYLNRDWQAEHGGSLDLRHGGTGRTARIDPISNRLVIMLTKSHTFHGYRSISFPPGTFRTSIAAYAYSEARPQDDLTDLSTTTTWVPEGKGALKSAVARVTPGLVTLKQRLVGSSTARKR